MANYSKQISGELSVARCDPENAFDLIRADWRQLFATADCAPFLSWEWQSTWNMSFGANSEPFILKTYRGDRLIGILPLRLQEKKLLGALVKRLSFIGEDVGGAGYLDLIAKPSDRTQVLIANLEFLKGNKCFDILSLDSIAPGSKTAECLRNHLSGLGRERLRYDESTASVCPIVDLCEGWPSVLKRSKRERNFKRRLKQLERMPGFEFRSISDQEGLGPAFERFLRLHELRWSTNGGSELSGHPRLVSFQRDLIKALAATGLLRFDELWVDGGCRSSVYGLDDGQTFYSYNTGYDPEWASFSVGLVLAGLSIRDAVERGNRVYDFLCGEQTYKFDWANRTEQMISATLVRKNIPALAFIGAGRIIAKTRRLSKRILPTSIIESLKSWRRRLKRNYQFSEIEVAKKAANV